MFFISFILLVRFVMLRILVGRTNQYTRGERDKCLLNNECILLDTSYRHSSRDNAFTRVPARGIISIMLFIRRQIPIDITILFSNSDTIMLRQIFIDSSIDIG